MKIKNTALLVMDVQEGIVSRLENKEEYLEKVRSAVDVAHDNGLPVIYVVLGFRAGTPEIGDDNIAFSNMKERMATMVDTTPLIPLVSQDIVVSKRRFSAFTGSDLEVVLRAKGIRHLVLTGVSTSGVVLSTVREAADKDYEMTVISDLCADFDMEVHTMLIEKVFPRQSTVITSEEWKAS